MASATFRKTEREVVVKKLVEEVEVTLVLSHDEAQAVQAVLIETSGSPDRSPRGLVDKVLDALREGIGDYEQNPAYPGGLPQRGTVPRLPAVALRTACASRTLCRGLPASHAKQSAGEICTRSLWRSEIEA